MKMILIILAALVLTACGQPNKGLEDGRLGSDGVPMPDCSQSIEIDFADDFETQADALEAQHGTSPTDVEDLFNELKAEYQNQYKCFITLGL